MGINPKHRADVPTTLTLTDLRRTVARLVVGTDVYADDLVLRQPAVEGRDDETIWTDLQSSARLARRSA